MEDDDEIMDGVEAQSEGSPTDEQLPMHVKGSRVDGQEIPDVAVFNSIPMSSLNEEQVSEGPSADIVTEATALNQRYEPNLRPET